MCPVLAMAALDLPTGCVAMIMFDRDDDAYRTWLELHPAGYVVNVRRKLSPDYVVLHRAACATISKPRPPGFYTEYGFRKFCGTTLDDVAGAPERCGRNRGSFTSRCGFCKP